MPTKTKSTKSSPKTTPKTLRITKRDADKVKGGLMAGPPSL